MKTLTAVMALATSLVATTPALSLVMRSPSSALARSAGGALRRGRRSLVMVESSAAGTSGGGASSASSFGTSTGPIGGGRAPDKLLTDAQDVLSDAVKIAQDVGLQTTLRRTIRGQRAILQTAVELAQELPRPPGSLPFPFPPSPPAELLSGKPLAEAIPAYLATLPKDLAPRTLRKLFERLGATYVKLGQFVASSPTVFPEEYVLEFQNCLDSTPTVSFETVKTIVEADLGKPLSEVYSKFDETPLASASVAQVHSARLVTGEDVVVKVQKPGVKDTLAADLGFLEVAAKALEFLAPDLSRLSVAAIVQDLRTSMLGELDFRAEGKCLDEFREFIRANGLEEVATAPAYYPAQSAGKVLTMERLYGVPLVDLEGIKEFSSNPEQTLFNALNTWTLSVVGCDFFHADVHAGNLLVLQDGRVGFIDFGIVGRIPPSIWGALQGVALGAAEGDYTVVAESLVQMGATDRDVDVAAFARDLEAVVNSLNDIEPMVTAAVTPSGDVAATMAVDEQQVTRLALDLVGIADRNGVKLPREFGILLKQILYFDRYTRLLAPDVEVLSDARLNLSELRDPRTDAIDV